MSCGDGRSRWPPGADMLPSEQTLWEAVAAGAPWASFASTRALGALTRPQAQRRADATPFGGRPPARPLLQTAHSWPPRAPNRSPASWPSTSVERHGVAMNANPRHHAFRCESRVLPSTVDEARFDTT